ncbi:MAG: DUF4337 family protein [Planctomycetota bacterium]
MGHLEHHMEHAAHAGEHGHGHGDGHGGGHGGGHGDTLGRDVGFTMAALGMLLALCSALVGAKRTEFIAASVAQTNVSGQYHALTAKHRVIQAQLQQLHARSPDEKVMAECDADLAAIGSRTPTGAAALAHRIVRLQAKNLQDTVTPTQQDLDRFAWLVMKFNDQKDSAREWSESYEHAVEAHHEGAERYEIGQLCAEIGIVLASIAMLMKSRKVWFVSMLLGIAGIIVVIHTWQDTAALLHHAERRIETSQRRYVSLSSEAADEAADEELVKEIEKIR